MELQKFVASVNFFLEFLNYSDFSVLLFNKFNFMSCLYLLYPSIKFEANLVDNYVNGITTGIFFVHLHYKASVFYLT